MVLALAPKLKELSPIMRKGPAGREALPVKVPPPVLVTVKIRSRDCSMVTLPKFRAGVTWSSGGGSKTIVVVAVPMLPSASVAVAVITFEPSAKWPQRSRWWWSDK